MLFPEKLWKNNSSRQICGSSIFKFSAFVTFCTEMKGTQNRKRQYIIRQRRLYIIEPVLHNLIRNVYNRKSSVQSPLFEC